MGHKTTNSGGCNSEFFPAEGSITHKVASTEFQTSNTKDTWTDIFAKMRCFQTFPLPFLMGSGCCLGETEVGLAGHTQRRGWSVSRGNVALCGGPSWRAYANTTKPTRKNNSSYDSLNVRCLLLLLTNLNYCPLLWKHRILLRLIP